MSAPVARIVSSTAALTAWNWWYPAIFLAIAPPPASSNTTKWRSRSRNRRCSKTPSSSTRSSGIAGGASAVPSMVRQGLNHSSPAPRAPIRAVVPSEVTRTAFDSNRAGIWAW